MRAAALCPIVQTWRLPTPDGPAVEQQQPWRQVSALFAPLPSQCWVSMEQSVWWAGAVCGSCWPNVFDWHLLAASNFPLLGQGAHATAVPSHSCVACHHASTAYPCIARGLRQSQFCLELDVCDATAAPAYPGALSCRACILTASTAHGHLCTLGPQPQSQDNRIYTKNVCFALLDCSTALPWPMIM